MTRNLFRLFLPEAFKKDGMKVKITAVRNRDMMSFHMYGTVIKIISIVLQ